MKFLYSRTSLIEDSKEKLYNGQYEDNNVDEKKQETCCRTASLPHASQTCYCNIG